MVWKKNARSPRLSVLQRNRLHKLAFQFLRIDSTNIKGTTRLARFIASHLKRLGFRIRFQRARLCNAPQVNLLAWKGPKKKSPLVMNTHLDTVTTESKAWTMTGGNPFHPVIKEGRLYGLGSADTKLALACQIAALEDFQGAEFRRPLVLTGTYGEEMGLVGVQRLIRSPWIRHADVLNSEPTELRLAIGNGGFRVYQVSAKLRDSQKTGGKIYSVRFAGKAAHSALPKAGINAVLRAIRWLKKQGENVQLLGVQGGLAPNIVPPFCNLIVLAPPGGLKNLREFGGRITGEKFLRNLRCYPEAGLFLIKLEKFLNHWPMGSQLSNLGWIEFSKNNLRLSLDHRFGHRDDPDVYFQAFKVFLKKQTKEKFILKIEKHNPAFYQSPRGKFVKEVTAALNSLGRGPGLHTKAGCTEAGYFAQEGCRVLTFGPGRVHGNAHQPNEFVPLKELADAVIFYREIIRRFCL